MSKPAKSQWNFGELFSPEETRKVLSVSELTETVRALLEKQIGSVWVSGEITNLRSQSSGHIYFTLKDASAQLNCVLFSREKIPQRDLLADGQKVLLQGDVTVYEARGQYQLIVRAVELQGVGALQVAFEKLKQKLAAEGLFATERKHLLPRYPQRIGLVTSPTGAAIRDVLHVVQRRNPGLEIILAPCRVQGDGAAKEIAAAIRLLNEFNVRSSGRESALTETKSQSRLTSAATTGLNLILVTRGGG
ncbi:MAG TPA: exodeoxyribonuclease VII large subunit, partial [Candidatus Limnocylindrales bacterium]|nr:exodeoxyribonuclease VII large subunit [Candidatus Limnocylindrales bacterium]